MRTQKLFAAIGLVAVLVVLGGASWKAFEPGLPPASAPQAGPTGLRVADLTLGRHFHIVLPLSGGAPQSIHLPTGVGLAISQVNHTAFLTGGTLSVFIRINGNLVAQPTFFTSLASPKSEHTFDPPLVIPPGSVLDVQASVGATVNVGGYFIMSGEL